jgi:hypothetical protein
MLIGFLADNAIPTPDTIRQTAKEVLARPTYEMRPTYDSRYVLDFIWRLLQPVFKFLSRLWDISPVLAWFVAIVLLAILVLLIGHILYTFRQALKRRAVLADPLQLSVHKLDPLELEIEAENAAVRHDYITAVRLLFRAILLRIAVYEKRQFRPGATNQQYIRRYSKASFVGALQQFVNVIDAKWYGQSQCQAEDYFACRQAHATICASTEVTHAHRA